MPCELQRIILRMVTYVLIHIITCIHSLPEQVKPSPAYPVLHVHVSGSSICSMLTKSVQDA